jgi:hypothetical protein
MQIIRIIFRYLSFAFGIPMACWHYLKTPLELLEHADLISSQWQKVIMNAPDWFGIIAPYIGIACIAYGIWDWRFRRSKLPKTRIKNPKISKDYRKELDFR